MADERSVTSDKNLSKINAMALCERIAQHDVYSFELDSLFAVLSNLCVFACIVFI